MKNGRNWFKFFKSVKSEKLRIKSVELAVKTNSDYSRITEVADKIYTYIQNES